MADEQYVHNGGPCTGSKTQQSQSSTRTYTMLENNPEVMSYLAHRLGLSQTLKFHDVYSLDDADLRAMVPRPVYGLLATIPLTETWKTDRDREDRDTTAYSGHCQEEAVFWVRQTIRAGCGMIGLLHTVINATRLRPDLIRPDSTLTRFIEQATPLPPEERARYLADNEDFYTANEAVAATCATTAIPHIDSGRTGNHFVAFVKGGDGHLWELEGSRKGPFDRGVLAEDEDVFSEKALELDLKRIMKMNVGQKGAVRFSCIALAPNVGSS